MTLTKIWHQAFLDKRPSLSLGLFRVAVAWTVGCHMIPSFFQMQDNYLATAFKIQNSSFFPASILRLVASSPDWLVWCFVGLFAIPLITFAIGLRTQRSCILMTLSCYYFYALNSYHIGTLSFDILLVTLFLMCVTDYPGDFLSLDSVRRGKADSYKRLRPYFIQRLLQFQLVWMFWYTALGKITAGGNWLTGNPYYHLMHYPLIGVVRAFALRSWLAIHPGVCYGLGVVCVIFELTIPFLWLIPRTRTIGITLGIAFQVMLWATLHVPTIFLFLFPPMMLLFVQPETLVRWIERQQKRTAARGRALLLYDGQCGFCLESITRLRVLDLFGWVDPLDFHTQPDLAKLHPLLTPARCRSEMVLVEPSGRLSGGFDAFARLCLHVPLLMGGTPLVYFPGARWVGTHLYRWVATHRDLLHHNPTCATNQCSVRESGNGSSNA